MRLFFETFWIPPKCLPFVCFDILQHNGCQKIPKGPPFTFFGTVTMFKNLILKFFSKSLIFFKGPPLIFFHTLQPTGVTKPKAPPLLQF